MNIPLVDDAQRIMNVQQCPTCNSAPLWVFFEMPDVPVYCNRLWDSQEAAIKAPGGDISLEYCDVCGMIYYVLFDPRLVAYTQEYENSLRCSPILNPLY